MWSIKSNRYLVSSFIAGGFLVCGIRASAGSYANIVLFIMGIIWLAFIGVSDGNRLVNLFKLKTVQCYSIFLLFFLSGVMFNNSYLLGIKNFAMYFLYLTILLIFEYYRMLSDKKYLAVVFKVSFLGLIYYAVKALLFYSTHQGAGRILAADPEYYGNIAIGGGYQIAYLSGIICCYMILKLEDKRKRILNVAILAVLGLVVLTTRSTITILITLLGCGISIISLFLCRFKPKSRLLMMMFITIFLICISSTILIFRKQIGNTLVNFGNIAETPVMWRIEEIGNIFQGNSLGSESATSLRRAVYNNSINIIKTAPVFGEMFTYGVIPGAGNSGGHSDILDAISKWGIVFGLFYLMTFYLQAIRIKNIRKKRQGYMLAVFLLMLLNPSIGISFCIGLFFLIPSMEELEKTRKCQEEILYARAIIKKDQG